MESVRYDVSFELARQSLRPTCFSLYVFSSSNISENTCGISPYHRAPLFDVVALRFSRSSGIIQKGLDAGGCNLSNFMRGTF